MKLWIDDVRPAPNEYHWARSVNDAKHQIEWWERYCKPYDDVELFIDIDHDASDFAYDGVDYGGMLPFEDKMWHDKEYPNIWYFQDGKEYFIKGKNFFTYGGAYSLDKEWRQLMHWTWYPNEIVSNKEHAAALDTIDHRHFNYVLTHTCPTDWQPVDLFMRGLDQSKVDSTMEKYLDDVLRYIGGYDY